MQALRPPLSPLTSNLIFMPMKRSTLPFFSGSRLPAPGPRLTDQDPQPKIFLDNRQKMANDGMDLGSRRRGRPARRCPN